MKAWKKISGTKMESIICALISLTCVIVIWALVTTYTNFGNVFSTPAEVFRLFVTSLYTPIGKYTIGIHVRWSLYRVLVGFSIGSALGIVTGLLMGASKVAEAIIMPLFEVVRPIPGVAWIPLAILWFGIGETPKYFIIGMSCFVICALNSYAGARRVDQRLVGAAKMLGATDRQVFAKVILSSSVPQIFAGLQIAVSASWHTVFAAEMVRSEEGVGWIIIKGLDNGDVTRILVGLVTIGIIGMLLAAIMRLIERRAIAWNFRGK